MHSRVFYVLQNSLRITDVLVLQDITFNVIDWELGQTENSATGQYAQAFQNLCT